MSPGTGDHVETPCTKHLLRGESTRSNFSNIESNGMTTPRKASSSSAIATPELWFPWYDNIHWITQLLYSLGTPFVGFNQYSHIPSYSR